MQPFPITLSLALLLCALVAGFVFAFACVAMPGLASLGDHEFLRAFQVMDRVIQNNQPLFMLVWVGSVLTLIASGVLGFRELAGLDRMLLISTVLTYILAVQVPTVAFNVPLNNQLQSLDLRAMDDQELALARAAFEPSWNRWNVLRTVFATLTTMLLILLIWRL